MIIPYKGTVIRPPSEAGSLIFQITFGCSDNRCIFCPAYKDKKLEIKSLEQIEKEIFRASKIFPETRKIFFADGDAIIIEQEKLIKIFDIAKIHFPMLSRIGIYGSIKSIEHKTVDDLKELKAKKLGLIYLGFETGDEEVYRIIKKYGSPEKNVETCNKVKEADIKTNVTVILGLGGKKYSTNHAMNTAKILNESQPHQIACLTLMIVKGTPIYNMAKKGEFELPDSFEILEELKILIENLQDFNCLFFSNHASNYFPINARFPNDKAKIITELERVIKKREKGMLTADFLRGL